MPGRRPPLVGDPVKAAARIVDDELRHMAEQAFNEALARWQNKLVRTEMEFDERLRRPDFVASVGLPPDLPDFTVGILKRTMALDAVGPERPRRDVVFRRFGLSAPE